MATNILSNAVWYYDGDQGLTEYDPHTNANIESAYIAKKVKYEFSLNNSIAYTIDFSNMQQTRHGFGTVRKIERKIPTTAHYMQYPPTHIHDNSTVSYSPKSKAKLNTNIPTKSHTNAATPITNLATTPNSNSIGTLFSNSAATLFSNSPSIPFTNSTATPFTNSTATPFVNSAATPFTNSTATPFTNSAATPFTNSPATPFVNSAATPFTNSTATQFVNLAATSFTNSPAIPFVNSAAIPFTNSTAIPFTNSAATPITYFSPFSNVNFPENIQLFSPAVPSTYMPTTNAKFQASSNANFSILQSANLPTTINSVPYTAVPLHPASGNAIPLHPALGNAIPLHPASGNAIKTKSKSQKQPHAHKTNRKTKSVATEFDDFFTKNTVNKLISAIKEDDLCPICITSIKEPADIDVPSNINNFPKDDICALKFCSHLFHKVCIASMLNADKKDRRFSSCLSCPVCQTIHGVKTGNQPTNGTMDVREDQMPLPGHSGYGTITIAYNFTSSSSYNPNGFPRVCYIPASPEGRNIFKMLKVAFERRLIFTIGTSITSGTPNCVVWNNIHHKTERNSNSSGHGYPDPNYLKNVTMELAVQGVTEKDIK